MHPIITTIAGNGLFGYSGDGGQATNAGFNSPYAAWVDATGNIFIADTQDQRIRKVNTNGIVTTVAGDGMLGFAGDGLPAGNASFCYPRGLTGDGAGNLYISDSFNNRVRKLSYVEFADQPAFTVTNVNPASVSNNYSVIITSADGSVTSSVVAVSLQLPPIAPEFTSSNGQFVFTWNSVSNVAYQLQYATNLVAPDWMDLGSPVTATNSSTSTTDTIGSDTQRFYRVRLFP
jgi:hypothetical protein